MAASYMVALAALALVPATATMTIDFKDNASFTIALGDGRNILLESSPLRAFMHGAWHYNLTRNSTARMSGTDELGAFRCVNVSWTVADTVPLHTSLVTYPAKPDVAVFVVDLPRGAQDTNASNPTLPSGQHAHALDAGAYPPSVAFPAFQSDAGLLPQLGYLSWAGVMVGSTSGTDAPRSLQGMKGNGPVVLFDGNFSHTLVVSPMDNSSRRSTRARSSACRGAGCCRCKTPRATTMRSARAWRPSASAPTKGATAPCAWKA